MQTMRIVLVFAGSDVLGQAGLKILGSGWAFVGLGLGRCWAHVIYWNSDIVLWIFP